MKYMEYLPMGVDLGCLSSGGAPLASLVSQRAMPEARLNPNGSSNNHYAGGAQLVNEADGGEGPVLAKNAGFELFKMAVAQNKKKVQNAVTQQ